MPVITVQGAMNADKLGIITPHEHMIVDIRNQFTEFPDVTRKRLEGQKVNIKNLDALSRDPYAVKDNLVLNDTALAEQEVLEFKKAGGSTIVDATSIGIGRNPAALRKISRSTGLNIIAGCGYYTNDTHPDDMDIKAVDEIADEMTNDIKSGINGTDIRAGVIGEIGTSEPISPNEKKVLIASAKAQGETGVGIIIHIYPWGQRGLEVLDILSKEGVQPDKVSINHVDVEIDLEYCKKIAEAGAYLEFDNFGKEYFIDKNSGAIPAVYLRETSIV